MAWMMDAYSRRPRLLPRHRHRQAARPRRRARAGGGHRSRAWSTCSRRRPSAGSIDLSAARGRHPGLRQRRARGRRASSHERGVKVVAVSDVSGGVYNARRARHRQRCSAGLERPPTVTEASTGATRSPTRSCSSCDCDVLIPAALGEVITRATTPTGSGPASSSRRPTTRPRPRPTRSCSDRGVRVVPDILANAGGVTGSYFEWAQNIQQFRGRRTRSTTELQDAMVRAFDATRRLRRAPRRRRCARPRSPSASSGWPGPRGCAATCDRRRVYRARRSDDVDSAHISTLVDDDGPALGRRGRSHRRRPRAASQRGVRAAPARHRGRAPSTASGPSSSSTRPTPSSSPTVEGAGRGRLLRRPELGGQRARAQTTTGDAWSTSTAPRARFERTKPDARDGRASCSTRSSTSWSTATSTPPTRPRTGSRSSRTSIFGEERPTSATCRSELFDVRRELLLFRRAVVPLREVRRRAAAPRGRVDRRRDAPCTCRTCTTTCCAPST